MTKTSVLSKVEEIGKIKECLPIVPHTRTTNNPHQLTTLQCWLCRDESRKVVSAELPGLHPAIRCGRCDTFLGTALTEGLASSNQPHQLNLWEVSL